MSEYRAVVKVRGRLKTVPMGQFSTKVFWRAQRAHGFVEVLCQEHGWVPSDCYGRCVRCLDKVTAKEQDASGPASGHYEGASAPHYV